MLKKFFTVIFLFVGYVALWAQSIETDPLVKTLKEELEYNTNELKKQDVPAYFLSLRLVDTHAKTVSSKYGVSSFNESNNRIVAPIVRVGNMDLDNYKFTTQNTPSGRRDESGVAVPVEENSLLPYRMAIWRATNDCFLSAVRKYEDAKAKMSTAKDNEDKAPCFSAAPVERYYEAPLSEDALKIDVDKWRKRLDKVTSVFKECRDLERGSASLQFQVERKYYVNSEGTVVVQNRRVFFLLLDACIKATDGIECPLRESYFGFEDDEMPDEATLVAKAKELIERLYALRDAPLADPYAGPAILSGGASGVFFHEIFGHRLEAHRMKTGGQTFKSMMGQRVLPTCFNVYSDPTLKKYGEQSLNGYYKYDDEGVKPRRVRNVKDGLLNDFLLSRVPIDGFLVSNGHGRAGGGTDPVARQSNLIVETSQPYSEAQLRKMLKDEAKRQGKEFGYYVRSATSGLTYLGDGKSINSFNVDPVEVFRVFVDGRPDQLVRGVTLIGTPLAMFSCIEAGGDSPVTFTGFCGAESGTVPVTAISPMIYVSKIETQRNAERPPLPRVLPLHEYENFDTAKKDEEHDFVLNAMKDEMARTKNELKSEDHPLPYFADYRVLKGKSFYVSAKNGDVTYPVYRPNFYYGDVALAFGDNMNMSPMTSYRFYSLDYDYDLLRRDLWSATDNRYKAAINAFSNKKSRLKNRPLPEEDAGVPDFLDLPAKEYIMESCVDKDIDTTKLVNMVREISCVMNDYPRLDNSNVYVSYGLTDHYRVTSEGICMRTPEEEGIFRVTVSARTVDGSIVDDVYNLCLGDLDNVPSVESIKSYVRDMIEKLLEQCDAEAVKEYYSGPVLLEDEAVSEAFYRSVVMAFGCARRDMFSGSSSNSMMLGKRIVDTKLNLTQLTGVKSYNGVELLGNYTVDANGVEPARSMPIVEKGILRNLLCGRFPALGAVNATGAERYEIHSTRDIVDVGVLHVTSEKAIPQSKIKSVFVAEAKKAGLKYAYIVKAPKGRWRYLVRLNVETGEETIVRVNGIPQPNRKDLMHVTAVSKEEFVTNKLDNGNVIVSCINPKSVIVENMEINFDKPYRQRELPLVSPSLRDAAK